MLRPDGTLWLNLGDSYANDGKWGGETGGKQAYLGDADRKRNGREKRVTGLKPKDLCGIPWRVAFALQDDGWFLRQDIVWAKPNPMPESVVDRCTKSHEYIFMLTKNPRYYFDQEAILEPLSPNTHLRVSQDRLAEQLGSDKVPGKTNGPMKAVLRGGKTADHGLGIKNNDSFEDQCSVLPGRKRKMAETGSGIKNNESMDAALVAPGRKTSGNLERKPRPGAPEDNGNNQKGSVPWEGYERNKRSVWTVTTVPFGGEFCRACQTYFEGEQLNALRVEKIKDGEREIRRRWCSCGVHDKWLSHFATFPTTLIDPCIKAGSSEKGCCAKCGAPWERLQERVGPDGSRVTVKASERFAKRDDGSPLMGNNAYTPDELTRGAFHAKDGVVEKTAAGWSPSCKCDAGSVPCTVLDLFGGAGTTGMAADRLRRDAILIEINPEYAIMAAQRIEKDGGMFSAVEMYRDGERCTSVPPASGKTGIGLSDSPAHEILSSDMESCDER